ncbi:MAG: glycosyltransferase family 4 protein [Rhizobiaceae bacterium]|nr:glycosyltransferase family 4 protein [Rhizobiaceae bacterium]
MNPQTRSSGEGRRPRIAFVSFMCLLDAHSGAARSVRTMLEMLAAEGFECRSITTAIFDGNEEYPRARAFGQGATAENIGKILRLDRNGVAHHVLYTESSQGGKFSLAQRNGFVGYAIEHLKQFQPDVIISYGSSESTADFVSRIRGLAPKFIFYLGNPNIDRAELFAPGDIIFCPTQAQVDRYRERLGLRGHVFRTPIGAENAADPKRTLALNHPGARKKGFVTFINPGFEKGATLAFTLARRALRERPDITFLVVEGRTKRAFWERNGSAAVNFPNIWWIPNQTDVPRIYERTSVLLFPSFWFEVAGRCIAEAQLGGIPVLASSHGGIPEQLNGGGFMFDIPEACKTNHRTVPDAEAVAPWFDTLTRLMDDDQAYAQATARALDAAAIYDRAKRQPQVAQLFRQLIAGT